MYIYDKDKMLTYLRGYLHGAHFLESEKALGFACDKHSGQKRKDGQPYIIHPLSMACYAVALHGTTDDMVATILLHDVVEDCGVPLSTLPVNDNIKRGVKYMTITPFEGEEKAAMKRRYFRELIESKEALMCKGIDRFMNLSTMEGIMDEDSIKKNIIETHELLMPVLHDAKNRYPELSNALHIIRASLRAIYVNLAIVHNIELDFNGSK
ncbi:bifunctional (p)ppGpp synthetase/guanosine-3',5'-bis(diphosphate) 3'-pyrophosphohydrolase [Candidatus Saccharibacteria bacterium]|nr:bifunctional (p)ppGpp synthetase/guanosine-3',5'-bis(diphosphate) 3'-pyrophosphohydrolase [Candidatus Saccharibacteria bacterium]